MLAALKTIHEMLGDRGYTIRDDYAVEFGNKPSEQRRLVAIAEDNLTVVADKEDLKDAGDGETVYVFFAFEPKLGVAKTRTYTERMEEDDIGHAIMVCAQMPSHQSREELKSNNVEIFTAMDVFKNRTTHKLVPKHEVVSDPVEIERLMRAQDIDSLKKYPVYKTTDRVVRYYNWPVGTLVRIYRTFGAQREPEIDYRVVRGP
jgi:DNA-directed RNA polymerase subunit H (RpoH/RPB5)